MTFTFASQDSKKGQVMSSADWKLDSAELASLFNEKTKAIIFNNPNNPLGKVFTRWVKILGLVQNMFGRCQVGVKQNIYL